MQILSAFYRRIGKRIFNLLIAMPALILLSPWLAVLALLARIKLGSPVLFRQQRPGLHGRPFTLYQFRTMTDARDAAGNLPPDAERLTSFGRSLCGIIGRRGRSMWPLLTIPSPPARWADQ